MSNDTEILSPEAFQARLAEMQAQFQQQIAALQASGNVAEIQTASAQYQAEVAALTQRFQADMAAESASMVDAVNELRGNSFWGDASLDHHLDPYDAVPTDDECAHLMLLGAMYVEENNMLDHLVNLIAPADLTTKTKSTLIEFFSSLDMNIEGIVPIEMQTLLSDSWGIESSEALKNMLGWLLKEGHNQELQQLIKYSDIVEASAECCIADFRERFDRPLAYEDYSEDEFKQQLIIAENVKSKLTKGGIAAWDIARYVHLLRLGYMAEYMSANDCWIYLRRLKQPAGKLFESWNDFVNSYTQGYRWWAGTSGPIEDACHRLLENPNSPWLYFGWLNETAAVH